MLLRIARGGEVIRVQLEERPDTELLARLNELPEVDGELTLDGRHLTGAVADAGRALGTLVGWLGEQGVTVVDTEEVAGDYEDAFVRLIEAADTSRGAAVR